MKAISVIFILWACVLTVACRAEVGDFKLPRNGIGKTTAEVRDLFISRCTICHTPPGSPNNPDVLNVEAMKGYKDPVTGLPMIDILDPERSILYGVLKSKRMPLGGTPFNAAELKLVYDWMLNGAEDFEVSPPPAEVPHRPYLYLLQKKAQDIVKVSAHDAPFTRWLEISNLTNGGQAEVIELVRHAVTRVITSLSVFTPIRAGAPYIVDEDKIIIRINLHDYNIVIEEWDRLLQAQKYPYFVKRFDREETGASFYEEQIAERTECDFLGLPQHKHFYCKTVPWVNADWFVFEAFGDQYYELAYKNKFKTMEQIRAFLGINLQKDFGDYIARRSLLRQSGVAVYNRALDWTEFKSFFGPQVIKGVWTQTYDFDGQEHEKNVFANPFNVETKLVVKTEKNFVHQGGEFIFKTPTGQNGYGICQRDPKDNQCYLIQEAPTSIVHDPSNVGPNHLGKFQQSVNVAHQCASCHDKGVNSYVAEQGIKHVVSSGGFNNAESDAVKLVFGKALEIQTLVSQYVADFTATQVSYEIPHVQYVAQHTEPTYATARYYADTVDICELGGLFDIECDDARDRLLHAPGLATQLGYSPDGSGYASRKTIEKDFGTIAKEFNIGKQIQFGGGNVVYPPNCVFKIKNHTKYAQRFDKILAEQEYGTSWLNTNKVFEFNYDKDVTVSGCLFYRDGWCVPFKNQVLNKCTTYVVKQASNGYSEFVKE